jgi:hypothetical protein
MADLERDLNNAREKYRDADRELEKATSATREAGDRMKEKASEIDKERGKDSDSSESGSVFT